MLVAGQVASLAEKLLKPPSTKCKAVAEEEMETDLLAPTDITLVGFTWDLARLELYPRNRF